MRSQQNSGISRESAPEKEVESRRISSEEYRRYKRILIALACIAVFALVTAVSADIFTSIIGKGRQNLVTMPEAQIETEKEAVVLDDGKTLTYKGHKYRLNENMISLCIIGRDKEAHTPDENFNGQADLVMVLAIDSKTGKMTGIVIPRDSMVDVDVNYIATDELYKNEKLQISLAYAYGTDDDSSSKLVARAASRALYNIPIDYYYTLGIDAIYDLTDAVEGVVVEPLETIPNTYIVKGEKTILWGEEARKYVQWRDIQRPQTALDRQARQIQFMKSLVAKTLRVSKGKPARVLEIYNVVAPYATTNLETSEVSFLASIFAKGSAGFDTISLKGESALNEKTNWEEFTLDRASLYQTILDVYYTKVE